MHIIYVYVLMNVLTCIFSSHTIVLNVLDILVPSAWQCFQLLNHSWGWKLSLLWKITCICISLPSLYHRKQTRRIINERGVLCLSWTGCLAQTVGKDAGCRFVLGGKLSWGEQSSTTGEMLYLKPNHEIRYKGFAMNFYIPLGVCWVMFCLQQEEKQDGIEKNKEVKQLNVIVIKSSLC